MSKETYKIGVFSLLFIIAVIATIFSLFRSIEYEQKVYELGSRLNTLRIQNELIDVQLINDYKKQNYDQLQDQWKRFAQAWNEFERMRTLYLYKEQNIDHLTQSIEQNIEVKYQKILHFESDKAVLSNSLFFLYDIVSEMHSKPVTYDPEVTAMLGKMLNDIVYYNVSSNVIREDIRDIQPKLLHLSASFPIEREVLNGHLEMIANKNSELKQEIVAIRALQIGKQFANLQTELDSVIERERNHRLIFNSFIAAMAIIMLIGFLVAFYRTYSDKKKIEALEKVNSDQNRHLREKVQLLNEYKRALDESSIVSKTDTRGIITYVNQRFCDISGYRSEELLGQPHNIIRHPEFPSEVFAELWKTIKGKKVFHGIIRNRKKTGEDYYVNSTIVPIMNEQGDVNEYIAIRNEVTELIHAKNAAIEAGEAKSAFLANMSHELRTPLNAIIGFSQILMVKPDTPDATKSFIEKINIAGKNLLALVNTILDFSKIEAGKLTYNPEMVQISELITEVATIIEPMAQKKFIHFNPPEALSIELCLDRQLITQVFLNLLSNAVKFTPEYGTVDLRIRYLSDEQTYIFSVCDSGVGISPEDIKILFEPFMQIENQFQKSVQGTGLGLTIVKRIVEDLHGGKIWVESEVGKGSCFYFSIPVSNTDMIE